LVEKKSLEGAFVMKKYGDKIIHQVGKLDK
jgi:hypothetical protein